MAFSPHASVVKLPEPSTRNDHVALLAVLNSSTACFWLKQKSHNKGEGGGARVDAGYAARGEAFRESYEFSGTTLQDFPLPRALPTHHAGILQDLSAELRNAAPAWPAQAAPSREDLRRRQIADADVRSRMRAHQEELDWETYHLYGLADRALLFDNEPPAVEQGERAFEIVLARRLAAGELDTTWFSHPLQKSTPNTEVPHRWPESYRRVVQARIDAILTTPHLALLESPNCKRRWAIEPWEIREKSGLRRWLLDRLEDRSIWFDRQGRPTPQSVGQLADRVTRDSGFTAVLELWEGRRDVQVAQALARLLGDEAVPYLAAFRLKDSGLRKLAAWQHTWALQRRQDAGERVGNIPVPPNYTNADFRKVSYWQARGKLDVAGERFIAYPEANRTTDSTLLIGWGGWDHAQKALALGAIIGARESDGASDELLVPLVAGLAELQPWVEQWHSEIDPAYGVSLAAFCGEQLTERARQVGRSLDQLRQWRPMAPTRGRRARS
jgi:hypothetical protein